MGEVGLGHLTRLVDLRKDHLAFGTELGAPGGNVPLLGAQLALLIPARVPIAQQTKQRLPLERCILLNKEGCRRRPALACVHPWGSTCWRSIAAAPSEYPSGWLHRVGDEVAIGLHPKADDPKADPGRPQYQASVGPR